jgi:hypothetical protein
MAQIRYLVLDEISKEFFVISEWGWDASTTHSEYKQRSLEDVSDSDSDMISVQNILVHGADIVPRALTAPGQLTLKDLESKIKDCEYFRKSHSR